MKVKEGFLLRNMGGQDVVVSIGAASKVFNGMVKLNETGAFLWTKIVEGAEKQELVQALLDKYDVDEELANRDVESFIETLEKPGIIE